MRGPVRRDARRRALARRGAAAGRGAQGRLRDDGPRAARPAQGGRPSNLEPCSPRTARDAPRATHCLLQVGSVDLRAMPAYGALGGKCLTSEQGEYEYEVCPFRSARQKQRGGGRSFSLGSQWRWAPLRSPCPRTATPTPNPDPNPDPLPLPPSPSPTLTRWEHLPSRIHAASCVDRHVDCPKWAAGGECGKNPAYMHKAPPRPPRTQPCVGPPALG